MNDIRETWESGKPSEVAFWRKVAEGREGIFKEWREGLIAQADPETPIQVGLAPFVPEPVAWARIVDLAAGPVSCVGWKLRGIRLNVTPIDVLAEAYDTILAEAGIVPPVRTVPGEAEAIDELFAPGSIDLVYIRNALDHCHDVPRVIDAALTVLRPGGHFVIHSIRNEAENEKYAGLHQWNITTEAGHFVVHRPGVRIDVTERLGGRAAVAILKDSPAWVEIAIEKAAA